MKNRKSNEQKFFIDMSRRKDETQELIKIRFRYGCIFFIFGLILVLFPFWENLNWIVHLSKIHGKQILWCCGASLMGMGAGLFNSRDVGSKRHRKYLVYFLVFVFPIATCSALLAGLLAAEKNLMLFYLSSMLVAIAIGFSGDSLAGKLRDLIKS